MYSKGRALAEQKPMGISEMFQQQATEESECGNVLKGAQPRAWRGWGGEEENLLKRPRKRQELKDSPQPSKADLRSPDFNKGLTSNS